MKPDVKRILTKLSKEKQNDKKLEKVDLSLVNRIEQFTKELQQGSMLFMTNYMGEIEKLINNGRKERERLEAVSRLATKSKEQYKKLLEELGANDTGVLKELDKALDRFQNYVLKQSRKYLN